MRDLIELGILMFCVGFILALAINHFDNQR